MSTPRTVQVPPGVRAVATETDRGTFATHQVRVDRPRGHVLLVPGWTGSKEDFTPVLPLLAMAGLDATAYDQRGQFETASGPDPDFSLAGLAADALALAAATSSSGPSHVLGHSFGGLVAQHVAVADPSACASLSLLCTGPGALGDSPLRPLEQLVEAIATVPMAELHARREAASGLVRPPEVAAFLERRFVANDPASLAAITRHLIDAPDVVDDVAATGLPVWVARGADDDAWPFDVQDEMAARLGTTVHVIEGAAHSPGVETPEALAAAWVPFLLEVPA